MKKRILSLLLVLIMVFTLIPVYSMADTEKNDAEGTDIQDIIGTLKGLIGDSGNIGDILAGLDKDQLIEIFKGLLGDSDIGGALENLDIDQIVALIKGLISGDSGDIGDILAGLDKDQLIEILKGLLGDSDIGGALENLDIDQLVALIKGLINGDLDFGSIIKGLDPSLILKLISALFGSDLDIEGPSNVTVTEGQDATFSVKVNVSLVDQLKGIEYSYIWIEPSSLKDIEFGSGDIDVVAIIKAIASMALSTEDSLVIKNTSINDSGRQFVCIVYNLSEKVLAVSDTATLTVTSETGCAHSDMTFHAAVSATCTTDGSVAYYECNGCHNLYLDAERTVQTNAKDVILPAFGHTEVIDTPAVKATCTEPGCTEGSHCSTCDAILSVSTAIPAAGHKFEGGIQCTVCGEYVPFPFVDVPENMWCRSEVDYVWKHGLMQGVTTTTFEPNSGMTRAQFVTVLYRMAGCPDVTGLTEPFADVDENYWAYNAIVWGYNKGVIKGYTATTFQPKTVITRAQVVTMLYRNEGEPDGTASLNFVDNAAIAEPYREAVAWAVKNNIIQGYQDGTFQPNRDATRAHMAVIIARFCENYKAF